MAIRPKVYLDAGILISAFRTTHVSHINALKLLDRDDVDFYVSEMVKLETLPDHKRPKPTEIETKFYTEFFEESDTYHLLFDNKSITRALDYACKYPLDPIDAMHVACAIEMNMDFFVTSEKDTKPYFLLQGKTKTKIRSICPTNTKPESSII